MKQINGTDLIKEYVRTSLEIRLKDWDGKEAIYFKGISAADLHSILEDFGFSIDEDSLDLKGWEGDYWLRVKYNDVIYTLGGSFYYGTHSIYKED